MTFVDVSLSSDQKMSAVPPSFGDLGKSARDLFDKEFSKDYVPPMLSWFFNDPPPLPPSHAPEINFPPSTVYILIESLNVPLLLLYLLYSLSCNRIVHRKCYLGPTYDSGNSPA